MHAVIEIYIEWKKEKRELILYTFPDASVL